MNLKSLVKDKRVQYGGIAAAAGAGALVWYRRSKAGASSSTAADGSGTSPAAYSPGTFPDTTQTDSAAWLGDNEAAFMAELNAYLATLQTATPAPPTTPSPVPVRPHPPVLGGTPVSWPVTGVTFGRTGSYTPAGLVAAVRSRAGMSTAAAQPVGGTAMPGRAIRL